MTLHEIKKDLLKLANQDKARVLQRFFKTGEGEYGERDIFIGVVVPSQRKVAKKYLNISLDDIKELLCSKIHEHRLTALLILVDKYKKSNEDDKNTIFEFYLENAGNINNWDLVDLSAPNIAGDFLLDKDKTILYKLVSSDNLWERRIAIMATFTFIRNNKFDDAFKISEALLKDKHDLIHKAVGWMLREIGNRDLAAEEIFLKKHYKIMPRTMLRYAIEKFDENKRKYYLKRRIF